MISLNDLHDATLLGLEVDWKKGEIRLTFCLETGAILSRLPLATQSKERERKTPVDPGILDRPIVLVASGLTGLSCPRQFPWGPSNYVNHITWNPAKTGSLLVVEMQSGDQIEASIKDFVFA